MDEQRLEAYLTLVKQLLNCSQGKEGELLQASSDLVDAGLLDVMGQVAAYLASQGNQNAAWLRNFAVQLAQTLGLETVVSSTELAKQFLWETLQLVCDEQGNSQQIYQIWTQQQNKFNPDLLAVLPIAVEEALAREPEQKLFLASLLCEFGTLIQQFSLGTRWLNLEIAIQSYKLALPVYSCESLSEQWAGVQNNLANALRKRIRGDRAENIEQAIEAYQCALKIYTFEAFPWLWAMTQNNLAFAYSEHIRGDRAENIEQAIKGYQRALEVYTYEASPERWAGAQNNLATAYCDRIRGDRAENIEHAITAYQHILEVYTHKAFPEEWAMAQNNLATAYCDRIRGDRAENIEQAIIAYQQSLQVRVREAVPVEWAQSMMNLANAYSDRIQGNRAENIEQAIAAYQQSLQVMTREAMPVDWATSMMNLASAYCDRIRGDRAENIEQAITAYQSSLEVFKPELFPHDCRRAARGLGNLYSDHQRWLEAVSIYQLALQAAELLYQSANLLDGKLAELAATADLPRRAAYALVRMGALQQAVETLEKGRARGLSQVLERDRSNLTKLAQIHPKLVQQYRDTTAQLRNLEVQQRQRMTSKDWHTLTPESLRNESQQLRQALDQTIEQIRRVPGHEAFRSLPTFDDVCKAVQTDRPLVYLVSTPAGSLALIVTPETIEPVWFDAVNETQLIDLLKQNWFAAYNQSQSSHQEWLDAIDSVTRQLWDPLMAPLIESLKQHSFQRATLIPTGYLSLLPLHAAWTEDTKTITGKRYALDEVLFTYAPNARSLVAAEAIAQQIETEKMLAIDNPRQDLPNSSREVERASSTFSNPEARVLQHEQATVGAVLAALPDCTILHLACHGRADLAEPLTSGLWMHDGLLTLRDLFDLKLTDDERHGIRLAVLSACETGLSGLKNADEAIGLPTGLLQAGAAGVIASLWSVSDFSTMMLLGRFYDYWHVEKLEPAIALRKAQQWIRDTTDGDKEDYFSNFIFPDRNARSYSHPFHWAAFSYTGV